MIVTVFPKDIYKLPSDFPTYREAEEYAAELRAEGIESDIEATSGECV
jgi:hypothetical protein